VFDVSGPLAHSLQLLPEGLHCCPSRVALGTRLGAGDHAALGLASGGLPAGMSGFESAALALQLGGEPVGIGVKLVGAEIGGLQTREQLLGLLLGTTGAGLRCCSGPPEVFKSGDCAISGCGGRRLCVAHAGLEVVARGLELGDLGAEVVHLGDEIFASLLMAEALGTGSAKGQA